MSILKLRAGLLGLLALLALSAFSAAPALAVSAGPFCHHREVGGLDEGKITEAAPEEIAGHGGTQTLTGKVLGISINVIATQAQVKGIVYNNADQCQSKVSVTYENLSVEGMPLCAVKVNSNNVVKLFGHQAWKWNGTAEQLNKENQKEQHRDWIFTPVELQKGATGMPTATYASLTFTGAGCSILVTQQPVQGSATAEGFAAQKGVENQNLEQWGKVEEIVSKGGEGQQHFYNGTKNVGVQTALKFGSEPAKYKGTLEVITIGKQGKTPPQEIAYFES